MLRHKKIDRVCCVILALTLVLSAGFVGAAFTGVIEGSAEIGYESRLFDASRVHTIEIVMDDWEAFLDTCTSEEYAACQLVIDGEVYKNAAIRGKGNTSLSSVAAYGNDRYSFKVEFDHYQSGSTYHGLDKLSLNNLIQDNTYMKDYFAYTLMNRMGVAAPLCSFVQIQVNGQPWGLYLAVEGVEDSFLQRNYGKDYGELYKPDSLSFGGGRGNGGDFDMAGMAEQFGFSFGRDGEEGSFTMPDMNDFPQMMGGDWSSFFGGDSSRNEAATPAPTETPAPTQATPGGMPSGFPDMGSIPSGMPGGAMPDMDSMPDMGSFPGMGNMPEGFDPSQFMGTNPMNAATATPAPTESPEATPASSRRESFSRSDRSGGFEMPGGGNFGGFGSSTDVKLQYTDDNPESYSNIFNNAKTDISDADQSRLIAALKALSEGDTSAVDQEAVIRYMAVHHFLCNDDSYTGMMVHNYYLYEEDGALSMIPWDYNLAYGGFMGSSNATSTVNTSIHSLVSMGSDSDRPMAGWIMADESASARYYEVYQELVDTLFSSGWFAEEIDRVIAMIAPYVEKDPTAFCTYEEFETAAQVLKEFCLLRAESVSNQLSGNQTTVNASHLNLSLMGTMGGMGGGMGGGFEMPNMDFGGMDFSNPPTDMPNIGGNGGRGMNPGGFSFGGSSANSKEPPAKTNAPNQDEKGTPAGKNTDASAQRQSSRMGMNTPSRESNQGSSLLLLSLCAVLLLGALIFLSCYKTNR